MGLYDDDFLERTHAAMLPMLPLWGLSGDTELRLLNFSENATFLATDSQNGRKLVLRANRPGYHSLAAIQSELAWITALRAENVVLTPAVVDLVDGGQVASFQEGGVDRYVVAFEFMEGREPDADTSLIPGFELLGGISARLHQHARRWTPPEGFTRHAWDFETAFGESKIWGDWRDGIDLTPEGVAVLEWALARMRQQLEKYGNDPSRFGVVHTDLRLANLLARGDEIAVIDFDDMGFSWYMYDFASAITFIDMTPIATDLQAAWLRGYRAVAPLDAADEAMIPTFMMYRRLALVAWIASHSETDTAREAGLGQYTRDTVTFANHYLGSPGL